MSAPAHVVWGFIVQCAVCPQRVILLTQPDGEWTCPRCADAHAEPAAVEEYPVAQVRI